jgi:phosphoserine phosphatase
VSLKERERLRVLEGVVEKRRLQGENCRAAEKVRLLQALPGALEDDEVYAYGDSDGDTEMLAAADHPAFKPFRASP